MEKRVTVTHVTETEHPLQTALHLAIANLPSSLAVVRLLLSRGADWSVKSDDEDAGTAREQGRDSVRLQS